MRSRMSICFLPVCGLLALPLSASAADINWAPSYRDAKKAAKEAGTLMMIDFYTDW